MEKKAGKIVPSRGILEDWSNEKEDELLDMKRNYSEKMMMQQNMGSPDFNSKYGSILTKKTPNDKSK